MVAGRGQRACVTDREIPISIDDGLMGLQLAFPAGGTWRI